MDNNILTPKQIVAELDRYIIGQHEAKVAVAIALFGTTSPAALATTVGVLTEVPVMLTLVRIANRTQKRFQQTSSYTGGRT